MDVVVALTGQAGTDPAPAFSGRSRPAGEYSGYTLYHLPAFPKNVEAIPASLAARIAFSSF